MSMGRRAPALLWSGSVRGLRSIAAGWIFACGLAGCGAGDGGRAPVTVERVLAGSPEREASLRAALGAALERSAEFVDASGRLGALRLAVWLSASDQDGPLHAAAVGHGALEDAASPSPSALFLHVELEVPSDLRSQFDVPAITTRMRLPDTDPAAPALASAAEAALQVLNLRLGVARGRGDAAAALLGADDPELKLLALEWIRDHPGPGLADAVAGQLEQGDPEVVALALEVLTAIGEARHAAAVVRRVERSPALAREGYRALAVLGGADAVGFLRFAAANEDEPGLRAEAERALSAALAGPGERVAARSHGVDLPRVARGHRQ